MQNQQSGTAHTFILEQGLLRDMYNAIKTVVGWCFVYNNIVILMIVTILFLLVLFLAKNWMKWLVVANIICWITYYGTVKLSFYSYGTFGDRYSLFFIPIWLVSFFMVLSETKEIIGGFLEKRETRKFFQSILDRRAVFSGICLALALVYCLNGWNSVKENWSKEDIRGVTDAWYSVEGYDISTLVYYASASGFSYYCEHDDRYTDDIIDNVVFMKWYRDRTVEEYTEYLDELFGENWPDSLYVVASHVRSDLNTILQCFVDKGYISSDVYNGNEDKLIYVTSKEK